MPERPIRRILLVGCPRSGTTLLQSMLGTHEDLFTFTESHFFPTYFHARNWMLHRVSEKLPERIQAFLEENDFTHAEDTPQVRVGRMLRWSAIAQVRKCLALFDAMAVRYGKSAWLEKTPDNLHRLGILEAAAPGISVIHIIRDPGSVTSSLVKASQNWSRAFTPESASEKWLRDVRTSLGFRGKRNHHFVLYEHLVMTPDPVVRTLIADVGLDASRLKLEKYREVAARVTAPGESWKANNIGAILPNLRRDRVELPSVIADQLKDTYESIYREAKSACIYPRSPAI